MNARKELAMTTTPESFVDALNLAFGKQTTQRSAHAKGVVLLGKFAPSAEAASVSKALHFKRGAGHGALFGQLGRAQDRRCGSAGRPAGPCHQVSATRRQ